MMENYSKVAPMRMPEGYLWCVCCEAFTPHEKQRAHYMDCGVCGESQSLDEGCPNCGHPTPELEPATCEVTMHGEGCHCAPCALGDPWEYKNTWAQETLRAFIRTTGGQLLMEGDYMLRVYDTDGKIADRLQHFNMLECSCPKVKVYRATNVLSYHEWPGHGLDCMNHIEWTAEFLCPVCHTVYEESDGNC